MKLKVSISTYNEIASKLEEQGNKIAEGRDLVIEKGTQFEAPVDFRLATIRRDCIVEAVKVYNDTPEAQRPITEIANNMYEFVINGKVTK